MIAKTFSSRRARYAVICGILCALLLLGLAFLTQTDADAAAVAVNGICGNDLHWGLYSDGTLTIAGSGEMTSWSAASLVPWYSYRSSIKTVVIGDSVTSIGDWAFYYCDNLSSITIPNGVTSIGAYAFKECYMLKSITIPDSVTSIGSSAFSYCTGLTEIKFNAVAMNDLSSNHCAFDIAGGDGEGVKITIGKGVTKIPGFLFCPYSSLLSPKITSVEFEEGSVCESIGASAFENCSSLTSITIPGNVASIGSYAFYSCSNLSSVTIPDSVTIIGDSAFSYCSRFTSITIPDSVTNIGNAAFSGCESLESITVEEGNSKYNSVGNCLIETETKALILGCNNSVIPNDGSITSIGSYAFQGCDSLTSITIPDGVSSIGNGVFYGCKSLKSITVPGSVTSIGDSAFYNCSSLTSITLPNNITSIGDDVFYACSSLTGITIPNSVTSIGDSAFQGCWKLTSMTIPDSVTSIGTTAFGSCTGLTKVIIGSGVTYIGDMAFAECNDLKLIVVKSNVSIDLWWMFDFCNNLNTIVFRSDNACVDEYKYESNSGGHMIWREDGEQTISFDDIEIDGIEHTAFSIHSHSEDSTDWTVSEGGDKVCSVCGLAIPALKTEGYCGKNVKWSFDEETGVLTISGKGAMKQYSATSMPWYHLASKITKVIIGEGVTSIGKNTFNNTKAGFTFTEITLPSTLTSIGNYAFYECTSLTNVNIPASVNSIGKFAFRGTALKDHTLGRCGKTVDWMLDNAGTLIIYGDGAMYDFGSKTAPWASYKDQIKNVVICEGVTSIGNCAFYECASIESIKLASTITSIGNYAFYGCKGLTEITVPASVTSIGAYAFRKCTALTTATFESDGGWSYGDASADISADALKTNYKSAWTRG